MISRSRIGSETVAPVAWYRRVAPRTVLAMLAALAAFDLGFFLIAVYPAQSAERETRARIARLASQVAETRRGFDEVRAAAERIEKASTDGDALVQEIALARRNAFSTLLTELEEAAEGAGVEIRETTYSSVEPIEGSEGYGILAVNANFRGSYEDLVGLLYRLDRSELFFIIGSLGATPRDDGSSNELRIDMRFDTFVRDL